MSTADPAGSITVTLGFDPATFLPTGKQGRLFEITPGHFTSIKELVELCGVLHTEIGELRLNGSGSDSFEVFPVRSAGEDGRVLQPFRPNQRDLLRTSILARPLVAQTAGSRHSFWFTSG